MPLLFCQHFLMPFTVVYKFLIQYQSVLYFVVIHMKLRSLGASYILCFCTHLIFSVRFRRFSQNMRQL